MSAVYRAYDTVMGREVALKRILPVEETNLNEASTDSLAREAAALARFQHPNVVTIFAFEKDAEGPFVVMELVEGDDLSAFIKKGTLSPEDFICVAEQCLEPLVAAGELNLLHRDIKPGNIMLTVTPSGRFLVKLLDFGLAKFSQQPSTQTLDHRGSFLGSIDFIAPEQLELRPLDQRTDLYSLGCVFYYMLVQESPFAGGNPAETSMNHINHRCKPIGGIRTDLPPLVADWLMRLISRQPEDRPADARDALMQFQDAVKGIAYVPVAKRAEESADDIFGIPFSGPVGPPPGDSVPPPSTGPVKAPTGAVVSRVIRTPSGPVPTKRIITGPVAGVELPNIRNSRQALPPVVSTNPARGRGMGPFRSVSRLPAAGSPVASRWKVIAGGAAGVITLIGLGIAVNTGEKSGSEVPEVASAVHIPLEPLPSPLPLSRSDGLPEPPPLPFNNGLFAWFTAGKGTFARDYQSPAEPGGQVAAWRNLASDQKERSLFRDGGDMKGEHLPTLELYGPEDIPGLRGVFRGVPTTNRTALSSLKSDAILPRGFSLVAVLHLEAGDDRFFRFQAPVWDGRYVQFGTSYDEKVSAINRGTKDGEETRATVPWKNGQLGILGYVWNPEAGEHTLLSQPAGSEEGTRATGPIEFEGPPHGIIAIGKRGFGDSFDSPSGNVIFEFLIFERVLSEDEVRKTMDFLSDRYFAGKG